MNEPLANLTAVVLVFGQFADSKINQSAILLGAILYIIAVLITHKFLQRR